MSKQKEKILIFNEEIALIQKHRFFVSFHDSCYFCQIIKTKRIMAKPIAPTPPLTGQAAVDFFAEMEQQKKATSAERARVKAGAERIKKMLTFNF
jgi:hypothetical protein